MKDLLSKDAFAETKGAFNVHRININSVDSGVTKEDSKEKVTVSRKTPLGYIHNGIWANNWLKIPSDIGAKLNQVYARVGLSGIPAARRFAIVVLNESGPGGLAQGRLASVTLAEGWATLAHELGHSLAGLGDEYNNANETFTRATIGEVNLSTTASRTRLKWRAYVPPGRPLPTSFIDVISENRSQAVGAFAGGGARFSTGLFHPVDNCRMKNNSPPFCPVCYESFRNRLQASLGLAFDNVYGGDFNGDGTGDVLLHFGNVLQLFTGSEGQELRFAWSETVVQGRLSWKIASGDRYHVADFDGDGRDDLYVLNLENWTLPFLAMLRSTGNGFEGIQRFGGSVPGWGGLKKSVRAFTGDFNGDRKEDLFLFNATDWSHAFLGMLQADVPTFGFPTLRRAKLFIDNIPGWGRMKPNDRFFVADFNRDGKKDLYIFNGKDWRSRFLAMVASTGSGLSGAGIFNGSIPGWGRLGSEPEFYVADFDGDRDEDLYIYNPRQWSKVHLGMLRSNGTSVNGVARFDDRVPGWGSLKRNARILVGDNNVDGRADLHIFNATDYGARRFLGGLNSTGSSLQGWFQTNQIGAWSLKRDHQMIDAPSRLHRLSQPQPGLILYDSQDLGLFQRTSAEGRLSMQRFYPRWIHNSPFHSARRWSAR